LTTAHNGVIVAIMTLTENPFLTGNYAPVAVERTYNNRYLFSGRVDPKSLVYQGIYQDWDIAALALK